MDILGWNYTHTLLREFSAQGGGRTHTQSPSEQFSRRIPTGSPYSFKELSVI